MPLHLRVFLASPGDVADERALALKVLEQLPYDPLLRGTITVEAVAWDKPGTATPMLATMTPQEAIEQGLPKPSECDIVIVIFWSRMGTPLPEEWTKPDGSRYRSGTEWEFWNAVDTARHHGTPSVLVYRRTERVLLDPDDPAFDEHHGQWQQVKTFFMSFVNPDDHSILGGVNAYGTPEEFREQLRDHLRELASRLLKPATRAPEEPVEQLSAAEPPLWEGSPFPGLPPFTPDDDLIFFGRGRETDALIGRLAQGHRFLAVIGASGAGKSSLVAAGLLPRLMANAIAGSRDWAWVRFTPGEYSENPFVALAASFRPLLERPVRRPRDEAELLFHDSEALEALVNRTLAGRPEWAELLLFIDQFEELFTLTHPEYQQRFITLLAHAAQLTRLRVILTLRADFYHRCVEFPDLAALLRTGSFPLATPELPALLEMITGPAAVAGLTFESDLPSRILRDTGSALGALALMAFALAELYETRQDDTTLTHAAYNSFDGVKGALAMRAETAYSVLEDAAQHALGAVFKELVEVDPERGIPTRKRAPLTRFEHSQAAQQFIAGFSAARLLVVDNPDQGNAVVEVAHEALLTHWDRLHTWITDCFDDLRLLRQVRMDAAEWERLGRPAANLWRHARQQPVYAMIERLQPVLSTVEHDFIRPEAERLLEEIANPATTHQRRAIIGDLLADIGDSRPGVGLDQDGLPEFVWLPVPSGETTLEDAAGTFTVQPFEISKYPVTWTQYQSFLQAEDGYRNARWWEGLAVHEEQPREDYGKQENRPAENVSWYDAMGFCRWLSVRLGHEILRLPTEWEWQQAATGGDAANEYPWGGNWNDEYANTRESGLSRTTAVGLYPQGASVNRRSKAPFLPRAAAA